MSQKSFKQTEAYWYELISETGFEDIEDTQTTGRPLREWHSKKFQSDVSLLRQSAHERYDECLDKLINSEDFDEICEIIVKHRNNSLSAFEAGFVIELHRAGVPEREIAKQMRSTKTTINSTLVKARSWMMLIA